VQQPVFRLIIIGGLYLAVMNIGFDNSIVGIVLKLIITLAYLVGIFFCGKVLDIVVHYGLKDLAAKTESSIDDEIIPIFHKTMNALVWVFGVIMIMGAWGVDIAPFLAGLGIAGLAISFALQSTLANIFAGVSLIIDKTFKVGDKVQLDTGELGTIHDISLRSTRLLTYDNEIIVIPNDALAKAKIRNFTQPDHRVRVSVDFTTEYGTNPEKVVNVISDSIKKNISGVLESPMVAIEFMEMSDFALKFTARFWIGDYRQAYNKKIEATNLIYNELNKAKIGIPFPTRTIYMKK